MRWYLRYSFSFRDVEELLGERGLKADHTTIWRWAQRYGPEQEERLRRHLKPTHKPWRVETLLHGLVAETDKLRNGSQFNLISLIVKKA